ncbi:DEKNAAC102745 [Brettanomyces naardenensis]|uniref:DEKNAAC102745 n=1 Tax=Brettanomyces naardenensis TaxID=13370 RepID=A0A448YLC3_BRENA|nr:DEKNAAC102745 [Brettanomyces naardenensis]
MPQQFPGRVDNDLKSVTSAIDELSNDVPDNEKQTPMNEKESPVGVNLEQLSSDNIDEVNEGPDLGDIGLDKNSFNSNKAIVEKIIDSIDHPDERCWTVRSIVIGAGLAIFGGVLQCLFYFKPQTIIVNGVFLMLIADTFGEFLAKVVPKRFKWLNPGPWTRKELTISTITADSASSCALAIEVIAVQKLWYGTNVNPGVGIFLTFSSQLLGYAFVGLGLKKALLYPSEMFYPNSLAIVSTIHALHNGKRDEKTRKRTKQQMKWFYICFFIMLVYEIIPEWMFPWLVGFSIPCLAAPHSATVSRIFGGTNNNEGMGLFSFCFDWNYIASTSSPLLIPLSATMNNLAGYFLCIIVFSAVYYGNVWKAKSFPFLSQSLYNVDSEPGNYIQYNQTAILDENGVMDPAAVKVQGLPYMTATYAVYLLVTNLSVGATFTYMYLFHRKEVATSFAWLKGVKSYFVNWKQNIKFWKQIGKDPRLDDDGKLPEIYDDIHMRQMLKYKEVPGWWYGLLFILCFVIAIICLYCGKTGLPWYMLIFAIVLAFPLTLFLGGLYSLFGFGGTQMQTFIQMIGGFTMSQPKPLANMYFTLYGYNSVGQAFLLLNDLKVGQYVKLPPRDTFFAQILGTLIGAIFNYIMMNSIVNSQFDLLKDIEATSVVWSGQNVQQYNTQGIAWGALSKEMFGIHGTYHMVPLALVIGFFLPIPFYLMHRFRPRWGFDKVNTPLMVWYIGWLCVGVNSSITCFFIAAIASQWFLRKYKPIYFKKYNYVVSAGLIGGAQVAIFILSFTIFGAGGPNTSHNFPRWWGNLDGATGVLENFDHCKFTNYGE